MRFIACSLVMMVRSPHQLSKASITQYHDVQPFVSQDHNLKPWDHYSDFDKFGIEEHHSTTPPFHPMPPIPPSRSHEWGEGTSPTLILGLWECSTVTGIQH